MANLDPSSVTIKTGRSVVLRSARAQDAPGLQSLSMAIASSADHLLEPAEEVAADAEAQRARIEARQSSRDGVLVVASSDGDLVGYAELIGQGHDPRTAHVATIWAAVHGEYRGRGVGSALIERAVAFAREHPVLEKITLNVMASNEHAIAIYQRLGFEEECRLERQIRVQDGAYRDVLTMRYWLTRA